MPRIKLHNLPAPLLSHLYDRARQRSITTESIVQLRAWLAGDPEVPEGDWFKRLQGLTVCGRDELIKTFLTEGQVPHGQEL
jgi:hypothetical protein